MLKLALGLLNFGFCFAVEDLGLILELSGVCLTWGCNGPP